MTLMLHAGAQAIDYDGLLALTTPEPTATHMPIPHHRLVNLVRHSLGFYGHEVVDQQHGVTPDGQRYFGLLTLKSDYGDYSDTVGLRNSNDRSLPIGIAFGSRVFVCDNTAFVGDQVIKTKHTAKLKARLPGMIAEIVEPLATQREAQARTFQRYKALPLTDDRADGVIMKLYRRNVLNITAVPDVLRQWDDPQFDWGGKTAFRLFNAVTFVLTGKVVAQPAITAQLHNVIDAIAA